ncbi:MaoC family dehydratase N-terminal domain-containing protein [Rhodococcus sp. HNM0569]|uniref:FAS1-like dehydratase domain-containing protein n=1 Tax=Rhodococcus sp. HNM0569 TaxID=2716340 RepID=UPI00146BDE9D|nr:MaoC family dehydratase [Rhodococcus sp. HNM0569]
MNPQIVGRVFTDPSRYAVGREKVAEFARAVSATSDIHFDVDAARAAGHRDVVAPPTFVKVVQTEAVHALVSDPDSGIDLTRHVPVHTTEKLEFSRHVVAGDELATTITVSGVSERGGVSFMNLVSDVHDQAGEHVVTVTSSLLIGEQQ